MNWLKAYIIFLIAFLAAAFVNIDRISLWADEQFKGQYGSPVFKVIRKTKTLYRGSAASIYSGRLDCMLSGVFNENYRSSLNCDQNGNLMPDALAEDEDEYLHLSQPVLKDMKSIGQKELLAALELSQPPAGAPAPVGVTSNKGAPDDLPSKPAKPVETTLAPAQLPPPHRILVVGDSLAIGLALSLRRAVTGFDEMVLIDEGKVSSGLANPRYYNWEKALQALVDKYDPNIVVVMMGANDAKYIKLNEKPRPPDAKNKSWPQVFSMRVEGFLDVLAEKNILSYWVGLPIMGDPVYAQQAQVMNSIVKNECDAFPNARFLDTWDVLADETGEYATFLKDGEGVKVKVRANDKIHFTVSGSDLLVRFFFKAIAKDVALKPKTAEETAMVPEAANPQKSQVKVQ